jgi:arylsulfatase A-like enzyme
MSLLPSSPGESASLPRIWAWFTGLLLLNELGTNVYGLVDKFLRAKVLNSLSDDAQAAVRSLALDGFGMLGLAALLTALVCLPWAAVVKVVHDRWRPRYGERLVTRMLFWFVAVFAGLHVYYSLHNMLLPSSRLCDSPLVLFGGSFDHQTLGWSSPRVFLAPLTGGLVLGASFFALWSSQTLRRGLCAGLALLWVTLVGYESSTGVGPVEPFTASGNVVLLGLDSFQENRLVLGGAEQRIAPNIEGFLEQSQRFDNAWTPFARTYPSWVSIFTGRYPVRHGVRFNLVPEAHLSPDNDYLAGRMADAGYSTLHATDETRFSTIRSLFGFEEQLHPEMGLPDFMLGSFFDFSAANLARQTALGHDLFPLIAHNRAVVGYNPRLWVRSFLRRLNELPRDKPAFITAHLCGNHWPFSAPWPYWTTDELGVDACIAMVDDQVGEILAFLDSSSLSRNATVFLLSDHGDGWSGDPSDITNTHGDHLGRLLANRVLLGVRGEGIEAGVSSDLVRTFDLYPTVLELAGLSVDSAAIDGRSLLPMLEAGPGGAVDPSRRCFAESGFDKKTFLVSRLIEEHGSWYEFDPGSRLITLKDEGCDALMESKSYMLLEGDLRLHLAPSRGLISISRYDAHTGVEHDVAAELPAARRLALLEAVLEHYSLDREQIMGLARQRGFLGSS